MVSAWLLLEVGAVALLLGAWVGYELCRRRHKAQLAQSAAKLKAAEGIYQTNMRMLHEIERLRERDLKRAAAAQARNS
jgi:hypothetical protein